MFKIFNKYSQKINIFKKMYSSKSYFKLEKNNDDIILTPNEGYDKVLIFMHGLGDSALGFRDVFDSENKPIPNRMKVVLPTANKSAVTINGGMVMNSWYDIKSFSGADSIEEADVHKSFYRVKKIIDNEVKNVNNDYKNVFVGGFSQGGSMSIHVGLTAPYLLGGIVCLSGYMFPFTSYEEDKKDLPIFIGHGSDDELIPEKKAKESFKNLLNKKGNIVYKSYDVGHSIDYQELEDVKNFINKFI